jgi:hypothetical protein
MRISFFRNVAIALLAPLTAAAMLLQSPFTEHSAISYFERAPQDPVARLGQKLARGEEKLVFDKDWGYLPSLLEKLNISAASQGLVFSKTSLQVDKIWPRRPRAIYFNDDVYLGWIPNAPLIEVASIDPKLGTVFYTVEQVESATPRLERQTRDCLICHDSSSTGAVPGLIVRSVFPDNRGNAIPGAETFLTTDRSAWRERWGGWYVTGTYGDQVHMGNLMAPQRVESIGSNAKAYTARLDLNAGANLNDVTGKFDSAYYLSRHSDVVALLVLTHQANLHNLITRTNYEALMAISEQSILGEARGLSSRQMPPRLRNIAEMLVRAMLFVGEAKLAGPVAGTSGFAEKFTAAGPRDRNGRSLRDLDLRERLFRYPLSYLIYSEAFNALPALAKDFIYLRLQEILSGNDTTGSFETFSKSDGETILQILKDTKPDFPTAPDTVAGPISPPK